MFIKKFKLILVLLFVLICATLLISAKYYSYNLPTFKQISVKEGSYMSVSYVDNGYLELKKSIFDKYNNKLVSSLKEISCNYKSEINEILGESYTKLITESDDIDSKIKNKTNEFLNSDEYTSKKLLMQSIKKEMDNSQGEKYDKLYEKFQLTLNEISTLNVKLNNSLKDLRLRKSEIKNNLTSLFDKNKNKLTTLRNNNKLKIKELISDVINEYNFELNELNNAFEVKQLNNREFPFDLNTFNFKCVSSTFEEDYFNDTIVTTEESDVKIEFINVNDKLIN